MSDDRPLTPEEQAEYDASMKHYVSGFTDGHIESLCWALSESQVTQFEICLMLRRKELTGVEIEAYEH